MAKKIEQLFSPQAIATMQEAIKDASGNEVYFSGDIDEKGIVVSVKAGARGNLHSVPVNQGDKRLCSVLIHNHPGGNLTPSEADISVASEASSNAQGFYIINNEVTEVYVVVEPVKPKKIQKLDTFELSSYLAEGGPLSKLTPNFEERPVQIELLQNVAESFNQNALGAFEAGTGVGKSYAYLIPSIVWALKNNERIVISTGTINLQQQLCEKDIPMAQKIIGKPVNFVLMKGRQNYVCKRRFEDVTAQRELFAEDNDLLDKLCQWVKNTETGSKSDLSFMPPEALWTRINSESDACMGMRCPYHSECFVMKMRKAATAANLLVVNHHLLFADIEARMHGVGYDEPAVLPPYKRIVFDEAHGIESAATSFFSESFSRFKILKQINQLYRKRKASESGYLCTLTILSSNEEKASSAYEMVNRIKNDIVNLEIAALDLMHSDYTLRLCDKNARDFGPVITLASTLANSIGNFVALSREVMEGIPEEDQDIPAFWESKVLLRRLEDACVVLRDFSAWDEKRDMVFWMQKKALPKDKVQEGADPIYVVMTESPLDIAPLMNAGVFEPMQTVVCTSATLKTGHNFSYWMNRTGLNFAEKERILSREFDSPFPYKKNMLFAVPNDAPLPEEPTFNQWIESALVRLIKAAGGRTLVLFTSYETLRSSFYAVQRSLLNENITCYRQGTDDNARLLQNFKNDITSVLFATDSFWQGVDVPGESLSQVIIVKLPFTVPNDPVFTARAEALEKQGRSSFMDLSVPEAVIKFRQGIGRLIRKSTDRGSVVVLDRRLYEKRYGSIFLSNVPECKKVYEPIEAICERVGEMVEN